MFLVNGVQILVLQVGQGLHREVWLAFGEHELSRERQGGKRVVDLLWEHCAEERIPSGGGWTVYNWLTVEIQN